MENLTRFNFQQIASIGISESLNSRYFTPIVHCVCVCVPKYFPTALSTVKLIFCALALPVASRRHHPHFFSALPCPTLPCPVLSSFVPHLSSLCMLLLCCFCWLILLLLLLLLFFIVAYLYIFNNLVCVCAQFRFSFARFLFFFGFWFAICRFVVQLVHRSPFLCPL